ncbi:unnamed protein product [Amoebophrya sp. A120]|nr:unnamed protein product [Amoebophrya sp. A120]|eukprot:GSA120T00005631001.1
MSTSPAASTSGAAWKTVQLKLSQHGGTTATTPSWFWTFQLGSRSWQEVYQEQLRRSVNSQEAATARTATTTATDRTGVDSAAAATEKKLIATAGASTATKTSTSSSATRDETTTSTIDTKLHQDSVLQFWVDACKRELPQELGEHAELMDEAGWVVGFSGDFLFVLGKLSLEDPRLVVLQFKRIEREKGITIQDLLAVFLGAIFDPFHSTNSSAGPRRPFEVVLEFFPEAEVEDSGTNKKPSDTDLIEFHRILADKLRISRVRYEGYKPANARGKYEEVPVKNWCANWFRIEMRLPLLLEGEDGAFFREIVEKERWKPEPNKETPTQTFAFRQLFGGKLLPKLQKALVTKMKQTDEDHDDESEGVEVDVESEETRATVRTHLKQAESYLQTVKNFQDAKSAVLKEAAHLKKRENVYWSVAVDLNGGLQPTLVIRGCSEGGKVEMSNEVLTKHPIRLFWNAAVPPPEALSDPALSRNAIFGHPAVEEVTHSLCQTMRVCGYRPSSVVLAQPSVCGLERRRCYEPFFRTIDVTCILGKKNYFEHELGRIAAARDEKEDNGRGTSKLSSKRTTLWEIDGQSLVWNMVSVLGDDAPKEKKRELLEKCSGALYSDGVHAETTCSPPVLGGA